MDRSVSVTARECLAVFSLLVGIGWLCGCIPPIILFTVNLATAILPLSKCEDFLQLFVWCPWNLAHKIVYVDSKDAGRISLHAVEQKEMTLDVSTSRPQNSLIKLSGHRTMHTSASSTLNHLIVIPKMILDLGNHSVGIISRSCCGDVTGKSPPQVSGKMTGSCPLTVWSISGHLYWRHQAAHQEFWILGWSVSGVPSLFFFQVKINECWGSLSGLHSFFIREPDVIG